MNWLKAVEAHHTYVKELASEHNDYQVIFTSLIGSQNYGLEKTNSSDVDTFTLILPNYMDFISDKNLISFEHEVNNGKCIVKDFRLAINNLRKTSPNSVEVFCSDYIYIEPAFQNTLLPFLNPDTGFYLSHANYSHMLYSIQGMAHQLHGRNMTEGKRYSHALRLMDLEWRFLNDTSSVNLLKFRHDGTRNVAKIAKFQEQTAEDTIYYKEQTAQMAEWLREAADNFEPSKEQKSIEYTANHMINRLLFEVTKKYLELNNFIYQGA